jgi:hypothetical protein
MLSPQERVVFVGDRSEFDAAILATLGISARRRSGRSSARVAEPTYRGSMETFFAVPA